MASPFIYQALKPDRREIRLIKLLPPGHGPSPAKATLVNCTLEPVSLDDKPKYQALSYVWGPAGLTSPICVDGKIFQATINLEAALRHIRRIGESLTLWIDAICIDQNNDFEKSDQVRRMRDIYRGAREVIIWLGQAKPEDTKVWNQLKELGEFAAEEPLEVNFDHLVDVDEKDTRASWYLNLNLKLRKELSQITIGYNNHDKILIEPLIYLLTLPWWSRMWVVQESSLARMARVVWGSNEMYWGILWAGLGYLSTWLHFQSIHLMGDESYHKAFSLLERSQPYWVPIVGSWERINRRLDGTKTKLIDMLLQTSVSSTSTATDPRDNIFGLMGLIDDADQLGIQVDYSQDLSTVFERTARALFQTEGLKMLQCCQFSPLHRTGDLPTWIPDWSTGLRQLLDGLRILLPSGVYNASGVTSASEARELERVKQRHPTVFIESTNASGSQDAMKLYMFDDSKPGILALKGAKVDTILAVSEPWEEAGDVVDHYARDLLWCKDLEKLAKLGNGIYSEAAKKEALWRTPVADRGLPRLTYIWYPRSSGSWGTMSTGYDVLMGTFALDKIEEKNRSMWYEKSRTYQKVLRAFGKGRRLFVTQAGLLGLGPDSAEVGDAIYIIPGASTPFVLRRKTKKQHQIIGECYVHGIMDGEFMQRKPKLLDLEIC
jgi:hypothetical protein